jgi:drug/metabolite transporter (DMT)-like permease
MLGASAAFACMAASVKLAALRGVPFGQLLFYRGFISLVLMSAYMRFAGVTFVTPHWKAHMQRGVAGFVGMMMYFGGIRFLPLAGAVTLNYTSPLIMAGTLLVMHRERPPRVMLAAMLSGFAGVILLMRPSYDSSQWFGVLLALGSAVTAVIAALNIRSLGQLQEPIARTAAYFALYATIGALPLFVLSDFSQVDLQGAAYLATMGVFATLGQVMLTLAYQRGHTLLVSLLGYSQVIFATLFGITLWGERPGVISWLAMALIVASGVAATVFVRSAPLRKA